MQCCFFLLCNFPINLVLDIVSLTALGGGAVTRSAIAVGFLWEEQPNMSVVHIECETRQGLSSQRRELQGAGVGGGNLRPSFAPVAHSFIRRMFWFQHAVAITAVTFVFVFCGFVAFVEGSLPPWTV